MQDDKAAPQTTDGLINGLARTLCRQDALRNGGKIGNRAALTEHVNHCWELFKDDARGVIGAIVANGYQILPAGVVQE